MIELKYFQPEQNTYSAKRNEKYYSGRHIFRLLSKFQTIKEYHLNRQSNIF